MKHYPMDHLKRDGQYIDKVGYNVKIFKIYGGLVLSTPYEVLANIKNGVLTVFTVARQTEYKKRKVKQFIRKYLKEIQQ